MGIPIGSPVVGYFAFFAVKVAGYSGAAAIFLRTYNLKAQSPFLIGGVRTLIGVATGAAYWGLGLLVASMLDKPLGLLFIAGLVPIRIAEWWLLIWLFYDRDLRQQAKDWGTTIKGTIWSFILDIPALAGLLYAGLWIS